MPRRQRNRRLTPLPEHLRSPDTPVNVDRAVMRFRSVSHRGTSMGFEPLGPVVSARSPEELERATAVALEERVRDEPEN